MNNIAQFRERTIRAIQAESLLWEERVTVSDRVINPDHHRFQLWAYAESLNYKTAHIAYLRHDSIYTFSELDLQKIALEIPELINQIETGNYQAQPSEENCIICPYNSLCEFALENQ